MNQTITTGPGFHFASVWEPSSNPLQLEEDLAALRADRDYWHEQWEAAVNYARELEAHALGLECQVANQMAEIGRLTNLARAAVDGK
jgi:hypothetical protein